MTRVGVLPLHASGGSGGLGSVVTALVPAAIELSVSALSFGRANREASPVPRSDVAPRPTHRQPSQDPETDVTHEPRFPAASAHAYPFEPRPRPPGR